MRLNYFGSIIIVPMNRRDIGDVGDVDGQYVLGNRFPHFVQSLMKCTSGEDPFGSMLIGSPSLAVDIHNLMAAPLSLKLTTQFAQVYELQITAYLCILCYYTSNYSYIA